ncbi:class II aaRS and biotin synthetase [Lindgomyces ingoldianus]|uniref:Class II aaRS and biotin synthetase n=1 Tax=Lindgomyces ingoldianus TaxID=673940 RepID=A0ACB6QCL6_9PLEO|nr:class II aaRS and biotin synthetase [Lindgomyces ingoldianus]KAF2464713.1 class II aaRS and biotin synthetase [Lindgomyces ingoldianus]
MASKKINVLVYSGNGSTTESVRHCLYTLRRLLSPTYAVVPVTGDVIIKEPWSATCALLVFPGGADLGYCRTLDGEGNRRISQYVNRGGSYLGFCAGGYYGCSRCEFEVDDKKMAVVGERELGFYPGTCRGLAFAGFVYHSEAGARAADLKINKAVLPGAPDSMPETFKSYYNGGGVFVDAKKLEGRGVQTLACYTETLHVDSGEGAAAVVYRKVGEGHVVLTGPHPEFAPTNLIKAPKMPSYSEAIDLVASTDTTRINFMRLMLRKLGLKVNEEEQAVPPLSRLHLSAHTAADVSDLVASWGEIFTVVDGEEYIKGENDCFHLEKENSPWGVSGLKRAVEVVENVLPTTVTGKEIGKEKDEEDDKTKQIRERIKYTSTSSADQILDYDKIVKKITPHEISHPSTRETPSFHHDAYYANLTHYHSKLRTEEPEFGKFLLYGEVVTSTNTLLEKNPTLLRNLPSGFAITATTQVSGRGRGSNVWVAPPGALMFSVVMHHPFQLTQSAPVIFIQYLAALAIVRGINSYAPGYDQLPIKLKWPNDIYAQHPGGKKDGVVKIGGILVNSSYSGSSYSLVCGIGLNLSNPLPTTSLNQLASQHSLKPLTSEKLLASILANFEDIYRAFRSQGFSRDMEGEYYDSWLHTDQIVTLETHNGARARIKGITRDWGLLLAEELGWEDRPTGRVIQLQSDSNSFDFFKGLVRRKV